MFATQSRPGSPNTSLPPVPPMPRSVALLRSRARARYALLMLTLALSGALIGALSGCASRPVILEQTPYWPFERIRLRSTTLGEITAYAHRPAGAVRAVVILQSPPCVGARSDRADPILSTGGVLWDELKRDSVLIQLERLGVQREEPQSSGTECRGAVGREVTAQTWSRAVQEVSSAVAGDSRLPTVYLGIGEGAWPAAQLAATDPRASSLLLINGTGLNPSFEALLNAVHPTDGTPAQDLLAGVAAPTPLQRRRPPLALPPLKVPTLLVQSTGSRDSPLESALSLLSQQPADSKVSLLVVEGLGADFGLNTGKIECFESVMRLLAQRTRDGDRPAAADTNGSALTRTYCGLPDREPPKQERTDPVRLPDGASASADLQG